MASENNLSKRRQTGLVNGLLLELQNSLPCEFHRKCCGWSECRSWKSAEFRQFSMYLSIIALRRNITHRLCEHFFRISLATTTICAKQDNGNEDSAKELLIPLVQKHRSLYGSEEITMNLYSLTHMGKYIQVHGNLDTFNEFVFYLYLCLMKQLIRCTIKVSSKIYLRCVAQQYCS